MLAREPMEPQRLLRSHGSF